MPSWLDYVICPKCKGDLALEGSKLQCQGCGAPYDVVNGIPVLKEAVQDTKLNIEEYTRRATVPARAIEAVYRDFEYAAHVAGSNLSGRVLEIGTGSGVLTEAMLLHGDFVDFVSTDVSLGFAKHTRDRLASFGDRASFVVSDGNTLPFRTNKFDAVLGRSVLHHLLHYKETLGLVRDVLAPGGVAVFYEPIQSGKAIIAFLFQVILEIDSMTNALDLTPLERKRLSAGVHGMTRSISVGTDEASLSALEDKYIFDQDEMRVVARELGFVAAHYINPRSLDATYFPYLTLHLTSFGVRSEVITKVRWLKEAFGRTIGGVAGDKLTAPMGYFVFKKG